MTDQDEAWVIVIRELNTTATNITNIRRDIQSTLMNALGTTGIHTITIRQSSYDHHLSPIPPDMLVGEDRT